MDERERGRIALSPGVRSEPLVIDGGTIEVIVCRVGQRAVIERIDPLALESWQRLVDGGIECFPVNDVLGGYCRQDGRWEMPPNRDFPVTGIVHGTVVLFRCNGIGEEISVEPGDLEWVETETRPVE